MPFTKINFNFDILYITIKYIVWLNYYTVYTRFL